MGCLKETQGWHLFHEQRLYQKKTKNKGSRLLSSLERDPAGWKIVLRASPGHPVWPPHPSFHPDMAHPLGKGEREHSPDENFSIIGAQTVNAARLCSLHSGMYSSNKKQANTHITRPPLPGFPVVWQFIRLQSARELVGGGHSGRGRCRPSMSGVSWGLWVALVGVQSPSEAWAALRWARRWVMEKPAFPSSWESTTSTCLQGWTESEKDRWEGSFRDLLNTNLVFFMLHCVNCTKVREQGEKRGCEKQS